MGIDDVHDFTCDICERCRNENFIFTCVNEMHLICDKCCVGIEQYDRKRPPDNVPYLAFDDDDNEFVYNCRLCKQEDDKKRLIEKRKAIRKRHKEIREKTVDRWNTFLKTDKGRKMLDDILKE